MDKCFYLATEEEQAFRFCDRPLVDREASRSNGLPMRTFVTEADTLIDPRPKEVLNWAAQMRHSTNSQLQEDPKDIFDLMNCDVLDGHVSKEIFELKENGNEHNFEPMTTSTMTNSDKQIFALSKSTDKLFQFPEQEVTATSAVGSSDFQGDRDGNIPSNEISVNSNIFFDFKIVKDMDQADSVPCHAPLPGTYLSTSNPTLPRLSSSEITTIASETSQLKPTVGTLSCIKVEKSQQQRFRNFQQENWNEMFKVFCEFVKTHGHSLIPHTYDQNPRLAQWVKRQRRQYKVKKQGKKSSMTQERLEKLEKAGFIWDCHKLVWELRFQELKEYKKKCGDCEVPINFPVNPQLSIWVKRQRRQYKLFWSSEHSAMNLERIAQLSDIGFSWELRRTYSSTTRKN